MGAIKPLDFIKFFVEQGMEFQISDIDNDDPDDWIIVNKDNFEEYKKTMEEKNRISNEGD